MYIDHKNLQYFTSTKELNQQQMRQYEFLLAFNFVIYYKKGLENARADALSRRLDYCGNAIEALLLLLREGLNEAMYYLLQQEAYYAYMDLDRGRLQVGWRGLGSEHCGNCCKECDTIYIVEDLDDGFVAQTQDLEDYNEEQEKGVVL